MAKIPSSALLKAKDAEIAKLKSQVLELERIIANIGGGGPSADHSTLKQGLKNGPETDDLEFRNELAIRRSARTTKKVDYVHLHNGSNAAAKRKRAEVDEGKEASVSRLHKKRYMRGKVQEKGGAGKLRDTSGALQNVHVTEDRAVRNVAKKAAPPLLRGKKVRGPYPKRIKSRSG